MICLVTFEEAVATVIRRHRLASNITQRELGFRCYLDTMTISRIERGVRLPSLLTLFLISKALGVQVKTIVSEIEALDPILEAAETPGEYRGKRGPRRK